MIIHNFNPILVDLGLFQIRWYSIAYILGIILGWIYATKIIKLTEKNEHNFEPIKKEDFDNLLAYLIIGIIVGGRLGYVFFYDLEFFSQNFFEILKIWQGGMSFHGGLAGVALAIIIFCRNTKANFFKYSDIISCVAPIGIFLGRVANFINGELYGKISNLPWAVIFPDSGNIGRHPSQIYEAILEGIILFILINYFALKKQLIFKSGYISGLFLTFYSILRIFSEIFREPDVHLGYFFNYFSLGVMLSIVTLIVGLLIIFTLEKK